MGRLRGIELLAVLPGYLGSIPTWQLTAICGSRSRGAHALSCLQLPTTCTWYIDMHAAQMPIHIKKKKEKRKRPLLASGTLKVHVRIGLCELNHELKISLGCIMSPDLKIEKKNLGTPPVGPALHNTSFPV